MKYLKELLIVLFITGIFTLVYVYQLTLANTLYIAFVTLVIYYFINKIIVAEEEKTYIKKHLEIADTVISDTDKFVIIIVKQNRVIWANDRAYEVFPEFLSNRNIAEIGLDQLTIDNTFKHNNNIYSVDVLENLYIIENKTKETRRINNLEENRPNIGMFQIDNYSYIRSNLKDEHFIKVEKDLREKLIDLFEKYDVFYQEVRQDRYQLIIPTSIVEKFKNNKFSELNEIVKSFNEEGIVITYSMGLAINFESIKQVGKKANEALELAITRGGAQVVLFDDDKTKYFGGTSSMIKGNIKMKSRVMVNTLVNIANKRDMIYVVSHRNPDSDAIASMLLLTKLLLEKTRADVTVIVDENISTDLEVEIQKQAEVRYQKNFVIDRTKRNLLVVLDTQSPKILSHPQLLEQIDDVIIFDHHQTPADYIKHSIFSWIEPGATSTVELIGEMLISSQVSITGNTDLANLAILGFLTDTNNMKYRVDSNAIEILGFLVAAGGSISIAREKTYTDIENYKLKHKLLMDVFVVNQFSILELPKEYNDIFLSQICNEMQEIKGIICSVVTSPMENGDFRVKIRSNGKINSKILIEEFGGGGHARQGAGILSREKKDLLIQKIHNFELKEE